MAGVSSWRANYPGLVCPKTLVLQPKLPHLHISVFNSSRFNCRISIQVTSGMFETGKIQHCTKSSCYPLYVGRNPDYPGVGDDFAPEPFWSNLLKQAFRAVKSLLEFLVEQPSQLKYIEWPDFQSTLKTATLTLLLVGLLIISLSSVDAALYYIYIVLTRRRA